MADEPKRHRIELTCPECGHQQFEPAMVVSTQCRSCRVHFKVEEGRAVPKPKTAAKLADASRPVKHAPAREPSEKPSGPPFRRTPQAQPPSNPLLRLLLRRKPPRDVVCFDCGHAFHAIAEAQSSQCPRCGGYVSLQDYDITESWNRTIKTRGNVTIRKTGSVSGITIQCHHLTVLGRFSGSVDCSGDLTIHSDGKINGKVSCRHLRVERGAHVDFLTLVETEKATIDGQVTGQIRCTGTITLEKRARLRGLVRAASLNVKPGAQHSGSIEIIQPPTE